jgi:hypothetical protein
MVWPGIVRLCFVHPILMAGGPDSNRQWRGLTRARALHPRPTFRARQSGFLSCARGGWFDAHLRQTRRRDRRLNRVFEESDQIWSQHVSAGADFDAADRLLPSAKDYVACYRADENVLIALET